uniref:Universal stress protein YxiE n=1 Tax=Anthurium amnicola TaxID=1678845 RepID=A0A1D1YX24_9ARAE
MGKKYLIPLDGSDHSKYSLSWALENLVDPNIDFVLLLSVGVLSPSTPSEYSAATRNLLDSDNETKLERQKVEEKAKEIVNEGKLLIKNFYETRGKKEVPVECFVYSNSDPAKFIATFTKEQHVDVLVMGHRGTSSPDAFSTGTVSQYCMHSAGCTVVITRKK